MFFFINAGNMGPMGPGMRPRGIAPQQFQQGYPQHPHQPMHKREMLGRKLGSGISITYSDNAGGVGQPQQASMRRPMPSAKNYPLASGMPSQSRQGTSMQDPVEVKQEPMDDMYEGDMAEEYEEGEEEEREDFGEEEDDDEEGDEDQEFEEGSMEAMEPGYAPYDEEVAYDNDDEEAYQQ